MSSFAAVTSFVDERCDVFTLGSILCETLTGEPAFTGRSSAEIHRKASRGELKEALTRLCAFARQLAINGKVEEAIREFEEASGIDPKIAEFAIDAAGKPFHPGVPSPVEPNHPPSTVNSESARFHLFVGSLLQKQGKLQPARSQLRRALLLMDEGRIPLQVIAAYLHRRQRPPKKSRLFESV